MKAKLTLLAGAFLSLLLGGAAVAQDLPRNTKSSKILYAASTWSGTAPDSPSGRIRACVLPSLSLSVMVAGK
ncbi:MAG TPA: hypothetical protein VJQ55_06215 [Candidatus Binatia bacterium]|nr:hypothetical protein [Candidatus Binatia bacterium]